jgi:hypothetical protein
MSHLTKCGTCRRLLANNAFKTERFIDKLLSAKERIFSR